MTFTRSFISTACVLLFAIGCGGDDGGVGTEDESSSDGADDDATMTDATMTAATMTDATMTASVGDDSSSSGSADGTGDSGTDTGADSGTDTGADSGTGTDSGSGTDTGAAACDANGMMACNEMKGCIFLNGSCTPIEDAACGDASNEEGVGAQPGEGRPLGAHAGAPAGAAWVGREIVTVVPSPISLVIAIVPWRSSTSRLAMHSPRPAPWNPRSPDSST